MEKGVIQYAADIGFLDGSANISRYGGSRGTGKHQRQLS